jgi:hypothetical protein
MIFFGWGIQKAYKVPFAEVAMTLEEIPNSPLFLAFFRFWIQTENALAGAEIVQAAGSGAGTSIAGSTYLMWDRLQRVK